MTDYNQQLEKTHQDSHRAKIPLQERNSFRNSLHLEYKWKQQMLEFS